MGSTGAIALHFSKALSFCRVPDEILFNILCRLDEDPRDFARLACVSTRFCEVIHSVCLKLACEKALPFLVAELLQAPSPAYNALSEPPGGWAALRKLHVCCPGLWHAGVRLRNWDLEVDQELDWFHDACCSHPGFPSAIQNTEYGEYRNGQEIEHDAKCNRKGHSIERNDCLKAEGSSEVDGVNVSNKKAWLWSTIHGAVEQVDDEAHSSVSIKLGLVDEEKQKKRRVCDSKQQQQQDCQQVLCHIAMGSRNFSREQGNKLLASRFSADNLYLNAWPCCKHPVDRRIYRLFRGVFKNFQSSHVHRNLEDLQAKRRNVGCAFCVCKFTWDMVSTFCVKRSNEFCENGEPVVRAYVCENGHVAGAWTY